MKCSGTPVRSHWVMNHLRVEWNTVPLSSGWRLRRYAYRFTTLSTLRCGNSLPDVGRAVSNNPSSTPCSGTSRSAALDFRSLTLIGPDADKPSQVALCCDVLRHEPTDLPRAHACEEPEEYCTVQHPVLGCQQDADLRITQHTMGMNLWPVFDLEGFPGVGSSSPSPTHQSRNWDICLRIRAWVWGARVMPSEAPERDVCKVNQSSLLPLPVLAHVGRELGDVPQHLLSMAQGEVTNSMLAQMRGQQ